MDQVDIEYLGDKDEKKYKDMTRAERIILRISELHALSRKLANAGFKAGLHHYKVRMGLRRTKRMIF